MASHIVTVVGGSGFLGRYVVKHLAAAGYSVRVLCRKPHLAEHVKVSGTVGQIVPDYADLAKPETLNGKFDGSFAVINLVGVLFEHGAQRFAKLHAQGAERVAQQAKSAGASRMIHVSALGVDRSTQSLYARTKLEGERAVQAAFPAATILRPGVLFGAEDNFFNQFARLSMIAPALPLIGGGKTRFQPIWVDDVARCIVAALLRDDTAGNIYELAGSKTYSFEELLKYVGEVTNRKRALIPLPYPLATLIGNVAQLLPSPMLTADQVRLLKTDNVLSGEYEGCEALGLTPTALEMVVPDYLSYRRKAA